jgi:VIT1/CCC1 family predicted Fe2+/Mn2+ transporter
MKRQKATKNMTGKIKSLLLRFLRGTVAGAIGAMLPLLPQNISDITNLRQWMLSLGVAGFIGGVTGLILTLDKAVRMK